jgi:hypothetical protein
MPQWLTGLLVGLMVACAIQALQILQKRVHHRNEKLLDAYAELVAVVSSDLGRATLIDAMIELNGDDGDATEFLKQEEKRRELGQDLSRLAFRIRMLEKDRALRSIVDVIARTQPFMVFTSPSERTGEYFVTRHQWFKTDIYDIKMALKCLVEAVQRKYSDALGSSFDPPRLEVGSRRS